MVENAIGGSGDDRLTGNDVVNTLVGGAGSDVLTGGNGNDVLDGGTGTDTAVFHGLHTSYSLAHATGQQISVSGADGTDLLSNVERFQFDDGVFSANFDLFDASSPLAIASFGASSVAGGWVDSQIYPRLAADINGDGRADLLGYGSAGVFASLATPDGGFGNVFLAKDSFGASLEGGGWVNTDTYPRVSADINGDGLSDLVGFGSAGVYASLAIGNGQFGDVYLAKDSFGGAPSAGGWTNASIYPRMLADIDGDGLADLIGFGGAGVYASLATGQGGFGDVFLAKNSFGAAFSGGGWSSAEVYPRTLGDVNGDGKSDLIGFGSSGVSVALATEAGQFGDPFLATVAFGASDAAGGWSRQGLYPREVGDINGDGRTDIIGFGGPGAYVSLGLGDGHFADPVLGVAAFGSSVAAGGWSDNAITPRLLADMTGDGRADIVAFGKDGVHIGVAGDFFGFG